MSNRNPILEDNRTGLQPTGADAENEPQRTHYEGCDRDHPQCRDARLAEIRERRGKIGDGFDDYLPLNARRIAPGEYVIETKSGVKLWFMEGASLAEWVCTLINAHNDLLGEVERARAEAARCQIALRDAAASTTYTVRRRDEKFLACGLCHCASPDHASHCPFAAISNAEQEAAAALSESEAE